MQTSTSPGSRWKQSNLPLVHAQSPHEEMTTIASRPSRFEKRGNYFLREVASEDAQARQFPIPERILAIRRRRERCGRYPRENPNVRPENEVQACGALRTFSKTSRVE